MIKKYLLLLLVLAICLSLCGCGKSEAAKECEKLIASIGEVSIDSKDAIVAAERAYSALTSEEKDSIAASGAILTDAIETYYSDVCKLIFSTLNDAQEIAEQFGTDLYTMGSTMAGGFKLSRKEINHLEYLLSQVNIHLTEEEMFQGIEAAVEGHNLLDGSHPDVALFVADCHNVLGELCLKSISNAYKLTGRVTQVRDSLYEASVMMAEITGVDSCAKQCLILEKYYGALEEYFDICLNCDSVGQIRQFGDMRTSYQGYVDTYTKDLSALLAG